MPTRSRPRSSTLTRALALAAAAGLALSPIGCSRENPTAKAVKHGGRDLHAISGGAAAFPPAETAKKQYTAVTGEVQPVADKGRPGDSAAANLLLARSQSGLAETSVNQAFAAERESMNRLTVLRSHLKEYIDRSIIAQAAGSFDPTARIAELGKSAGDLAGQIARAKAAKAELHKKIADLRAQAQAKLDEAQPHQVAYAELRQKAATSTATEGEALIKQANERKRAGDKLRTEADWINAQADQVVPQATEASVNISKLETLKAGLEGESDALAKQAAQTKAAAAEARAGATSAAEELRKKLDELTAFRAGPLTKAGDDALKAFNGAVALAKKAQKDAAGQSQVNVGELQQSIGDIYLARAVGLKQYADFLSSVATCKPEFPDASNFAKSAEEASKAKTDAATAAKTAYEAAKSAYEKSGAKGATKDRMQQVSDTLGKLSAFVEGKDADFGNLLSVSKSESTQTAAPAPAPVAAADPGAAAIAAFTAIIQDTKAGRFDKIAAAMHAPPGAEALQTANTRILGGLGKLDAACRAKFNKGLLDGLAGNPAMAGLTSQLASAASVDPSKLSAKVNGDQAVLTGPGLPAPITMQNINGTWKQVMDVKSISPQQLALAAKIAEPLAAGCDEAVAGIQSGELKSPEAAINVLGLKMQAAIMQLMSDPEMQKLMQQMQNGGK